MSGMIVTTLVLVSCCSRFTNGKDALPSNCAKLQDVQLAYAGWPLRLDCDNYFDSIYTLNEGKSYEDPDYIVDQSVLSVECNITDAISGKSLLHKKGYFEDVEKWSVNIKDIAVNSQASYNVDTVILSHNVCRSYYVKLNVTKDPVESCQQATNTLSPIRIRSLLGKQRIMQCMVPKNVVPKLRLGRRKKYSVRWQYNCSTLPPGVEEHKGRYFKSLIIPATNYHHPGVYACAVTYRNNTRYLVQYNLCVKPKAALSKPRISCKRSIALVNIGDSVTLECVGLFGFGRVDDISFNTVWTKKNSANFTCKNLRDRIVVVAAHHPDRHCTYEINKFSKCIKNPITHEERERSPATVTMKLKIRNVQMTDLGNYTITITKASENQSYGHILVKINTKTKLQSKVVVVATCIGFVVLIIFAAITLYFLRFYLSAYAKKWCGAYEKEQKSYGAFLSYFYSTDMDVFAQQQTCEVTAEVRTELESAGYLIYDECRNTSGGLRAETIVNLMERSHRVIIILTESYISDNWSVFQLQQGFQSMINSGGSMIFVLIPGMKAYIKQHASTDDTYRMIYRAIKINAAIEWTNKTKFNKKLFSLKLLHAMPKLRPTGTDRTSLSICENGKHPNGVDRLHSNNTATTEVSTDAQEATKV